MPNQINRRRANIHKGARIRRGHAAKKAKLQKFKHQRIMEEAINPHQRRMLISNPGANIELSKKKIRLLTKRMKLKKDAEMEEAPVVQEEVEGESMELLSTGNGTTLGAPPS